MMLKNYTEGRIMRIMNPQGEAEYVYVFREEDEQLAQVIKQKVQQEIIPGTEQMDPQTGQPVPGSGQPKYKHILNLAEIKGGFDLRVADNSTVSVSKVATFEQSMVLYQAGIIDSEAVLESADYPNKEEIRRRMELKQQQAMQAQQQAVQTEVQGEMGKEQMKSQTTLQKAQMDNQTKIVTTKMNQFGKSMDKREERLAKVQGAISGRPA